MSISETDVGRENKKWASLIYRTAQPDTLAAFPPWGILRELVVKDLPKGKGSEKCNIAQKISVIVQRTGLQWDLCEPVQFAGKYGDNAVHFQLQEGDGQFALGELELGRQIVYGDLATAADDVVDPLRLGAQRYGKL